MSNVSPSEGLYVVNYSNLVHDCRRNGLLFPFGNNGIYPSEVFSDI